MRALLVQESPQLQARLSIALKDLDYAVDLATTTADARDALGTDRFDVVVIDLDLGEDSLDLIKTARAAVAGNGAAPAQETRILVVGGRERLDVITAALDRGAEDFLLKPVFIDELRIRLAARAKVSPLKELRVIECGPLCLDQMTRQVTLDGDVLELTPRERAVLEVLLRNAGSVISKDFIASRIYSFDNEVDPAAIEIYIHRIRRKTAHPNFEIRTIRGLGYELGARKAASAANAA